MENYIATSINQSKKLIELGLSVDTADMWWVKHYLIAKNQELDKPSDDEINDVFPAWSLSALTNLLPSKFTEKGKYSETTYNIDIRKYALTEDVDLYQIAYGNYTFHEEGNSSWKDMINTGEKENLIDAVFEMVCYLLENKLI
jgi:hypothetical protein